MKQIHNEIPEIPANNAQDIKDPYFKDLYTGYMISEINKEYYHVAMEIRSFNKATGAKTSVSRVQMFDEKNWKMQTKDVETALTGVTVHILHDPRKPLILADDSDEEISPLLKVAGVGRATIEKLALAGIDSIEVLANVTEERMDEVSEKSGIKLEKLSTIVNNAEKIIFDQLD